MKEKLKPAHGNWVDGERFFDREREMELFLEKIRDGAHLLLVAQRRMGKTSLMREAKRRLKREGWSCLFLDLQKASTPEDVLAELAASTRPFEPIWADAKSLFANALAGVGEQVDSLQEGDITVTLRSGLVGANWMGRGDEVFDLIARSPKPVVLFVDELPIFVNFLLKGEDRTITPERREKAEKFMSWLRSNSQRLQGRLSMVLSGSIGLEPVLHQAALSATLNSFEPFDLRPWDADVAIACIHALAAERKLRMDTGAAAKMVDLLGCCIPHHVQMFFSAASDRCRLRKSVLDEHLVQEVFEQDMLSIRGHPELSHYEERLGLVLGPELLPMALATLAEASIEGTVKSPQLAALRKLYRRSGADAGDDQKYVLQVLEHDGYLQRRDADFRFVSNLLRSWWKARNELVYVPVLKR